MDRVQARDSRVQAGQNILANFPTKQATTQWEKYSGSPGVCVEQEDS